MKRLGILLLAAFFPWALMLKNDNPGAAFIALIMQATLIGWPFATMWAWRIQYPEKKKKKKNKDKE